MYINDKILIGKNDNYEAYILPRMANRHGIISGASGSGKTISLKVLAESFSSAGVPVFLVDVKGDLAGMCLPGIVNDNISSRINNLNLENFEFKSFSTSFFDVYGKYGIPVRTTINSIGPKLLSRMLNLTEAQEGVLTIVFKIAEDENLELIDLKDLRAILSYVGERRKNYALNYGNITLQSIGSIQRNLLTLEDEGGNFFFGKPALDINDFIKTDINGIGYINILHAATLFQKPTLYASFLLWLLTDLYQKLPEVGDLEKPKIAFFFDEAHLLFSEMPDYIIKQVTQIVKLIRSKGIGLYFISQSPSDIPDEILSQLGNRIQHVLRYYTKNDEKAIKAAANSFRENPNFDTEQVIKTLKTGEALVSFQDEYGQPTVAEKVTILPPQSQMGTIDDVKRQEVIRNNPLYIKYINRTEEISAYEKIEQKIQNEKITQMSTVKNKSNSSKSSNKKSSLEKAANKVANSTLNTLGRKIGNSLFKSLFK